MLTTLPLEAFVCREVMENYFHPSATFSARRHLLYTTLLVVSATALSLLTCDLGAVFELIGATSACALAYILPPLCYMRLSTRSWRWVPAAACVAFGVAVMGISTVQTVDRMVRGAFCRLFSSLLFSRFPTRRETSRCSVRSVSCGMLTNLKVVAADKRAGERVWFQRKR